MAKRSPLILFLVVAVAVASVVCCCATEVVMAQPQLPPCHQADHQDGQASDECECTQIQSLAVMPSFDIDKPTASQWDTIDVFSSSNGSIAQQSDTLVFLNPSHERSENPPPLYLKHSNLRL